MLHNTKAAQSIRLSKTLTAFHTANRLSRSFPQNKRVLFYYSLTAVHSLDTAKYRVHELTMLLWGMKKKKLSCGKKEKTETRNEETHKEQATIWKIKN